MKIISLDIKNFKGIPSLHIDFNGNNANVYGQNGSGKTTLYDAFLWLLFGFDSSGNKQFSVKPTNAEKGVEVCVSCICKLDGRIIELRKTLKERWTKKRGELEATYGGDETKCYVDQVPYKVTDYNDYISSICDEKIFKLLTNPMYFNQELHWKERRELLFRLCSGITDQQIFESKMSELNQVNLDLQQCINALSENPSDFAASEKLQNAQKQINNLALYKKLSEAMGNHTLEEFQKMLSDRRRKINKELETLPVRIDEAAQNLNNDIDGDINRCKEEILKIQDLEAELRKQKAELESNSKINSLKSELSSLRSSLDILNAQNRDYIRQQKAQRDQILREQKLELMQEKSELEQKRSQLISGQHKVESELSLQQNTLNKYKQQKVALQSKTWQGDTVCPTCGQEIPQDKIQESQEKFERDKRNALQAVDNLIKEASQEVEKLQKEEDNHDQIGTLNLKINELSDQYALLETPTQYVWGNMEGYEQEKQNFEREIATTLSALQDTLSNQSEKCSELSQRIEEIDSKKTRLQKRLLIMEQNATITERIQEYSNQQKEYVKQFEETEQLLYACDQFIKTKVDLVTEQVNGKFNLAKFKLFDQQKNGAINECCEVMVKGVPYRDLNSAMVINVGLDIINTMQKHYSCFPPCWVDNAESVTDVYKLETQTIKLYVSEDDKKLRCLNG
ncbi:MAG: AAA family ATPase [Massilioclostridium sp.]|nr:AAA family ATPase [Massilioclostridium sp.]